MGKYDDIIDRKRPISKKHKPMSMYERAAQFAPFAALKGHDEAIADTARAAQQDLEVKSKDLYNENRIFDELEEL